MEEITYCQYQKIIRKGAWDKFSTNHGILDIIISLSVSVFVGFIWFFVFKRGDDSVSTALAVVVVFFLIYSIVYLGYFAREHASIYNEQKNEIAKFEKENQLESLNLNVENGRIYPIYDSDGITVDKTILSVTNLNPKIKIVELEAAIVLIDQTFIVPDNKECETVRFNELLELQWQDGKTKVDLKPDRNVGLNISSFGREVTSRIHFGASGFTTSYLFELESLFHYRVKFWGKFEGENNYRNFYYNGIIYSKPSELRLKGINNIESLTMPYNDIPNQLVQLIKEQLDKK
jgi:hypothetical protein